MNKCFILIVCCFMFFSTTSDAKKRKKKAKAPQELVKNYSAEDQKTFSDNFQDQIVQAKTPKDKLTLAKELVEESQKYEGGVKSLILNNAYKLIAKSRDIDTKIKILENMLEIEGASQKLILSKLVKLQLKAIDKLKSDLKNKKKDYLVTKEYYILANSTIDNALKLCQICMDKLDFKAAGNAIKLGLKISTKIMSVKTPKLRWYQNICREMAAKYNTAKSQKKKDPEAAAWGYLEAGAYKKAQKLVGNDSMDDLNTILKAENNTDINSLLKAATIWEEKAEKAKGKSKEIARYHAINLYKKCLKEDNDNQSAQEKLDNLQSQMEENIATLRKPGEWVRLVDLPVISSSVGFGKFEIIKPVRCPFGIAGKSMTSGFKAHANSKIVLHLDGKYKDLIGSCGLCNGAGGKAYFKILCDGKEVFKSPYLWKDSRKFVKKPIKLKVKGVNKLELISEADCIAGSFSAWGNVRVK